MRIVDRAGAMLCVIAACLVVACVAQGSDELQPDKTNHSPSKVRQDGIDDLVEKYGGNAESQAAVAAALDWLARHQQADGSWSFDHRAACAEAEKHDPTGRNAHRAEACRDEGTLAEAKNAATGLALLPFLAAQHTHMQGEHRRVVAKGLRFLVQRMNKDGSLRETGGTMYSHGIASIALCEAYAASRDHRLKPFAAAALKHIEYAQDPKSGGWRYTPRTPGDTSVTGWQFAALQVGKAAGLPVSEAVWTRTERFLQSVESDEGARFGYIRPGAGEATTAIGLLSRAYLGEPRDEAFARGVDSLAGSGPSKSNMYFNFYAAQVLFHHGGAEWEMWNEPLRDRLIETQAKGGHERGSWFFAGDPGAAAGGRHYATCLAALNLEVYYRRPRLVEQKNEPRRH